MAVYTTIDDPSAYFKVQLYTGNGSANHAITFDDTDTDMQPDLVWIKNRDAATDAHCLFDAVRGATEVIHPDATTAEATDADTLDSFASDGFQVDADVKVNTSSEKCVAWCWKAGAGSGSSNEDGGINTTSTSVSQTAGVSISTWTGTGSTATIGHGLGAVPKFITTKARSDSYNWYTYHASIGNTKNVYLDLDNAASSASANFHNNTDPTSSVWTSGGAIYNVDYTFVTYAFAEKQGFSKFGSYTGNGNVDGTFINLGFRPAFVLTKKTSADAGWYLWDNKRPGYNQITQELYIDDDAETSGSSLGLDFLSNGFKWRASMSSRNEADGIYVYMAFAEAPFVNSNGAPCNAV